MKELKKYLIINSIFSLACGLIMLLFSNALNAFFHIQDAYLFPVLGFCLMMFSIFVAYVSNKLLENRVLVHIISVLDACWVAGSLVIVTFKLANLSDNGYITISMVGIFIGFLAYMQIKHNKKNATV